MMMKERKKRHSYLQEQVSHSIKELREQGGQNTSVLIPDILEKLCNRFGVLSEISWALEHLAIRIVGSLLHQFLLDSILQEGLCHFGRACFRNRSHFFLNCEFCSSQEVQNLWNIEICITCTTCDTFDDECKAFVTSVCSHSLVCKKPSRTNRPELVCLLCRAVVIF